jgi:uncharacterized membrane protein
MALNINGRTCIYFSVMWGLLGIVLINFVNPLLDKFLFFIKNIISKKVLKIALMLMVRIFNF